MSGTRFRYANGFDWTRFHRELRTQHLGRVILWRETIGTTMDLAKRELEEGAPHGTLVLAENQTAGRGRAGRSWSSGSVGMNLSFSVALRPTSFASLLQTNLAAAVAVCEACAEVCGRPVGGAQGVSIKWPNDVWCEGRKLSGMLLDSTSQQGGEFTAVLGIGINVNQDPMPPEVRAEATSLRLLLPLPRGGGRERPIVSREQLLASILNRLEEMLEWKLDRVLERYAQLELLRDGRRVLVLPRGREDPADSFEAEALGVGPDGCLRIRRADGSIHSLASGDVSIRPT